MSKEVEPFISEVMFRWIIGGLSTIFVTLAGILNARANAIERRLDAEQVRMAALVVKVDTMWAFQLRRALSEVVVTGVGKLESPLHMNDEILRCLDPLKPSLIALAGTPQFMALPHLGDQALVIEKHLGDQIVKAVCIPMKLTHGACLLAALMVAKQVNELEVDDQGNL